MAKKQSAEKRESMKARAERVLHLAEELERQGKTWKQANDAVFSPTGLATLLFTTPKERKEFSNSPTGKKVTKIFESLSRTEETEASGKFVVRVPKSLHAALQDEAAKEGVSLNQLVLTKVAIDLESKV